MAGFPISPEPGVAPTLGALVAHLATHLAAGGTVQNWPGLPTQPGVGFQFSRTVAPPPRIGGFTSPPTMPYTSPLAGITRAGLSTVGMDRGPVAQPLSAPALSALAARTGV